MRIFTVILTLLMALPAHADLEDDLASPLTTDAKWILLAGTGLTIATIATQNSLSGPWETSTARTQPLGKYSKYGNLLGQLVPNAAYAGGMLAASAFGVDKALGRAWMMFEATAYSGIIGQVIKMGLAEGRPYNSEVGSSFPSGHSLSAFSFAGIVATEHGWLYGAPAMAMAAFVAYSRINDNEHRLHDVIAGATIGLTCAYGISYAHHPEMKAANFYITPMPDAYGLAAHWDF